MFLVSPFQTASSNSGNSDVFSTPEYVTDHQTFALKTFEKDEFKALGLREYQLLKNIESNPHMLRVFDHGESAEIYTKSNSNELPSTLGNSLVKSNSTSSNNSTSS